jgi:hypothetical protein
MKGLLLMQAILGIAIFTRSPPIWKVNKVIKNRSFLEAIRSFYTLPIRRPGRQRRAHATQYGYVAAAQGKIITHAPKKLAFPNVFINLEPFNQGLSHESRHSPPVIILVVIQPTPASKPGTPTLAL